MLAESSLSFCTVNERKKTSKTYNYVFFFHLLDFFVSMFKYYKEMAKFRSENPSQVLNLHFEEMKRVMIISSPEPKAQR